MGYVFPTQAQCLSASEQSTIKHFEYQKDYLFDTAIFGNIIYEASTLLWLEEEEHPTFFIFDDRTSEYGNAIAIRSKSRILKKKYVNDFNNFDLYIGIGHKILKKYTNYYDNPEQILVDAEFLFILFHELGHLYQFYWLEEGALNDVPEKSPEILELNADYIAGLCFAAVLTDDTGTTSGDVYSFPISIINSRKLEGEIVEETYFEYMASYRLILDKISDLVNKIGETNFYKKGHHGTGAERVNAFISGFQEYLEENSFPDLDLDLIEKDFNNRIDTYNKNYAKWKKKLKEFKNQN